MGAIKGVFGRKRHTPVLEHEAGDTSRTACLSCSESRVVVTELEERLELADIESEVYHFVAGIALDLIPDVRAVGAGFHSIDLDHCLIIGSLGTTRGYSDELERRRRRAYLTTGRPSAVQRI